MTIRGKMSWRSRESTAKADASIDALRGPTAPSGGALPGLLVALAAPLAITALKLAWPEQLGYGTPFSLYFAAIFVGAWAGGLLGGGASVVLSALLGSYFFFEPQRSLARVGPEAWLGPAIFALEGLAMAWLTARVRAGRAQALARSRETQLLAAQLESVLASVDDAVSVQDPHGNLIYANQPAATLTGYPNPAALIAAPLVEVMGRFELCAADGSAFPMAELPSRKALQGLPAPEQLVRFRLLASGEERWLRLRAAPVTLPGGTLQYAVNVFHDVTELREREQALRISQASFATALHDVGDAVIATDAQGAVTFMNPPAERLSGWTSAEASGKPLAEVFQIADEITRVKLESPVERALRDEGPAALAKSTVLITRQGSELALDEARAALVPSGDGPPAGAVLIFRDATHRHDEARGVAEARAELEHASRAKDAFLAVLGRELRDPLASIVSALQQMQGDGAQATEARAPVDAPREHEQITVIERQVRHMARLADHMLDVSRITGGELELLRERSALAAVVAKAVELAGPALAERQHALVVTVPDDLFVECDVARLSQALANLLSNAAKYTPPRGHVEISASASEHELMLRVRDDGVGIEPELLPRVFEPFEQSHTGLDRARGGLGLGLAITRSLVELHGGQVTAHSQGTGRGSEFRVYLPLASARAAAQAVAPPDGVQASDSERPARLLLVDDNSDALQLLSQALRRLGHEVHVAEDAVGALTVAAMHEADVALLDVGLPVIDGIELATHLRSVPGWQEVKLVALSGYGQPADKQRVHAAGFDEHLTKPVSLDALSNVLSRLTSADT